MAALIQSAASAIELPDEVMYGVANLTYSLFSPLILPFDAFVSGVFPEQVSMARDYVEANSYPTQKPLPLRDPVIALFAVLMYPATLALLFAVSKVVGKLKCKTVGLIHNFFLFALSLYMWASIIVTAFSMYDHLWDHAMSNTTENDWRLAKLMWLFYVSKLPEFGDTFLMVLKQNYHQISFLHLYHHGSIFLFWYYINIVAPGGDAYFSAILNSGIHVIMYGYYFFTMLFSSGPIRRFFESIKFMITKGQMTQFMLNVCQSVYLLFFVDTKYHAGLAKALFAYMVSLLLLFGNFLIKGQRKAKLAKANAKKNPIPATLVSSIPTAKAATSAPEFTETKHSPTASASKRTSTPKRRTARKED